MAPTMDGVIHQPSTLYPGLWNSSHRSLVKSWSSYPSRSSPSIHQPLTRSRTLPSPKIGSSPSYSSTSPNASSTNRLQRRNTTVEPPQSKSRTSVNKGGGGVVPVPLPPPIVSSLNPDKGSPRTRLSSDTAFSEASILDTLDSSDNDNGGSCFSADVESEDTDSGESSWDDKLVGGGPNKRGDPTGKKIVHIPSCKRAQRTFSSESPRDVENGNVCSGHKSTREQSSERDKPEDDEEDGGSLMEAYELKRLDDPCHQEEMEEGSRRNGHQSHQQKDESSSEDDSSTEENDSESSSSDDEEETSSCECEQSAAVTAAGEETDETNDCPECLQEKSRALTPEVVVVRPSPGTLIFGEERRERRNSTIYIQPSLSGETQYLVPRFDLQSDLMHTGTPIDDDAGACRISEEEYIATLSIHESAKKGDLHVVKLLLKQDMKRMETVDERGWTPLHLASANGHTEVVKFLGLEGAHLAALDPSGYTSLHISAMNGKNNCIEVLLQMGLGVDLVTSDGFTPLHLAALNGFIDCCKTLILWGAGVDKKDALGRTVKDMAEEYNLYEVQQLVENIHRLMEEQSLSSAGSSSANLEISSSRVTK